VNGVHIRRACPSRGVPSPRTAVVGALLGLALAVHATLGAQAPGPVASAPESTLVAGLRDTGFVAWRDGFASRARLGTSFLFEDERFAVLALTPVAQDATSPDSLVRAAAVGCQRALDLPPEVLEPLAVLRPWVAFDSATRARPVVALVIAPAERRRFDCHAGTLARIAAFARGIQFGLAAPYDRTADVGRAEVRRDGLLEPVVLAGHAPLTRVVTGGVVRDGTGHLRLYLAPETFAPTAEGRAPRLEIHVWDAVNDEPDILPVPERVVRAVWQQMLPWRARQLAVVAPEAADAAAALDRLTRWPLPPRAETRGAMLLAAATFGAHDDPAAMSALLADVLEYHPCLTFSAAVPPSLREMTQVLRPPARCTSIPLPMIALRSLVPGGGQATSPGRRRLALGSFVGTGVAYLAGRTALAASRRTYDAYRTYAGNSQPPADGLFARAERFRRIGNGFTLTAGAVWGAATLEGLHAEWRHARDIAEVTALGDPRTVGRVRPTVDPRGIGLAVTW
jgi:hypothetical protein